MIFRLNVVAMCIYWMLFVDIAVAAAPVYTVKADDTLFVEGKKTYLSDENGEPLGAAWYDLWMTPEGKVLRKTRPISKAEMQREESEGRKEGE